MFKGKIPANGYDTGLSINGGEQGRVYILICSAHSSAGNSTNAGVYMIRCGYNGGNYSIVTIAESNMTPAYPLTISVSSENTIVLTSLVPWAITIISNKL